jgi:WD40 repeat protein
VRVDLDRELKLVRFFFSFSSNFNFLPLAEWLRVLTLNTPHRKRRATSVAWSPDGTQIASGSGDNTIEDNTIKLWNAGTFECQSTLRGHSDIVRAVSWSPDGTMLASGSDDKTIKLWDTRSGKVISTLSGQSDQ